LNSDALKVFGARIGNETRTFIPATQTIRPLRDHMVIEPLDWKPSDILEVIYRGRPLRGIVKAIGPGCYPKKYDHPSKAKRKKVWDSLVFRPTEVKVGDVVELGGLEIRGYLFETDCGIINWGGIDHIVCREEDVAGIVEEPSKVAQLEAA